MVNNTGEGILIRVNLKDFKTVKPGQEIDMDEYHGKRCGLELAKKEVVKSTVSTKAVETKKRVSRRRAKAPEEEEN